MKPLLILAFLCGCAAAAFLVRAWWATKKDRQNND